MNDIKLPLDATGKEIPLGTKVLYGSDGSKYNIASFRYFPELDKWEVLTEDTSGFGDYETCDSDDLTIDPPDSWEKLKRDAFDLSPYDYVKKRGIDANLALGSAMAQDVYRRARALAGDSE